MLGAVPASPSIYRKKRIWEDANGKTWISCNDPQFPKLRHNTRGCDEVLQQVSVAPGNFAGKAAAAE